MQQRDSAMHLECWSVLTALSTFYYTDGAAISDIPCALRDSNERQDTRRHTEIDEMKTKQILKISAAPAAVFCALAFFSTATPTAAAPIDYCRHDVTSGMRGCGYTSLEQCQAMSSGRGGSCYENPFPEGGNARSSAYAYQPKRHASRAARRPTKSQ
jgi:hypothetical protein